jgi:hypothetical protein
MPSGSWWPSPPLWGDEPSKSPHPTTQVPPLAEMGSPYPLEAREVWGLEAPLEADPGDQPPMDLMEEGPLPG